MTTFDDREKSFEKKFALDEELKFKSEQRRNKLLGEWAAAKLGLPGPARRRLCEGRAQGGSGLQGRRGRFPEGAQGLRRQGRGRARCRAAQGHGRLPGQGGRARSRPSAKAEVRAGQVQARPSAGMPDACHVARAGAVVRGRHAASLHALTWPWASLPAWQAERMGC